MYVREMTKLECEAMLSANRIGHLGCIADDKPYVIPIRYIFENNTFYSFSLPGKKVDALRANPQVCVQIDHLRMDEEWQSVLVEGRYQELPDDDNWHS